MNLKNFAICIERFVAWLRAIDQYNFLQSVRQSTPQRRLKEILREIWSRYAAIYYYKSKLVIPNLTANRKTMFIGKLLIGTKLSAGKVKQVIFSRTELPVRLT